MEYYAAVPQMKKKAGRNRGKSRPNPNDDYSFAPIMNLEIRRQESPNRNNGSADNSPTRSKEHHYRGNTNPREWIRHRPLVTSCMVVNLLAILVLLSTTSMLGGGGEGGRFASIKRLLSGRGIVTPRRSGELLREMRQHMAQLALARQETEKVFDTAVTTHQSVVENGFPTNQPFWESCTLERQRRRRHTSSNQRRSHEEPFRVVVLGGAGSARFAIDDCANDNTPQASTDANNSDNDESASAKTIRYSNLLETALTEAFQNNNNNPDTTTTSAAKTSSSWPPPFFEIHNMAHAAIKPAVQGLLLDQFVDVRNADVLVWERSRKEFNNVEQHDREMEFWFARLEAYFGHVGLKPPPIIVLHLWDDLFALDHPPHAAHAIDGKIHITFPLKSSYLHEQKLADEILMEKLKQGWDIQVINVGKTVLHDRHIRTQSINPNKLLVDEKYHSTCKGMKLVSNMIQRVLYKDLANCNHTITTSTFSTTAGTDKKKRTGGALEEDEDSSTSSSSVAGILQRQTTMPLAELLVQKDVRVASFSQWKPAVETSTSSGDHRNHLLHIHNDTSVQQYLERVVPPKKMYPTETATGTKEDATSLKSHQRISYRVPLCSNGEYVNFTIAEPNLEWLGMIYNGGRIDATLNGIPLVLGGDGSIKTNGGNLGGVRDWVHVAAEIEEVVPQYQLSLCSRKIDKQGKSTVWLHQLVGVMLPPSPSSP